MAFRQQYYLTRNDTWLKEHAWPVIHGAAEFWASRFVIDTASGNYTIKDVTGPDESSGKVDDEAYTNAIAALSIGFALECAPRVLGVSSTPTPPGQQQQASGVGAADPLPANWSQIVARVYLPVVSGIYEGGPIHKQDAQYKKGKIITQSAVGLLQYPLEIPMPTQLKINDLLYWQSHTKDNGFYTGDSSYSIAWLALGNRSASDAQFGRAFLYMNGLPSADGSNRVPAPQPNPFNVWKEQARDGNHLNFLTGAGGFLQNVMQGYGGLRARADRLDWNPVLPPHIHSVRFVRLSYAGVVYSISYNATQATLETHSSEGAAHSLRVCSPIGSSGPQDCSTVGEPAQATLSVGGFSLRVTSRQ
jgi:trehalose/maltose hydrolase-like predicted phosphorylase